MVSPCGSGKTIIFSEISKLATQRGNDTLVLVHRKELLEQANAHGNVAVMAQTLSRHLTDNEYNPRIIITDEAHHANATTWRKIFDYYPNSSIIGFTATPCRLDGKGLGDIFDDLIVGRTANELIREGWLCEYDYYAPKTSIDGQSWAMKGSDFDPNDIESKLDKSSILGDISKYLDPKRKTIIYCPTIAFSKSLESRFPFVRHFDGDTPDKERKSIMDGFRNGTIRALTNVDLIGEGVDVPDCDCVILLRPTLSVALYIQQAMRCLRPAPNKRAVIYDMVGNAYRHGLPTDDREWSLSGYTHARNPSGEPEITARECKKCFRVYSGTSPICPYCGFDNGKTPREIAEESKIELERITELKRLDEQAERKRAYTFESLVALGTKRGYKNPRYWAMMIMKGRNKHD